MCGNKTVQEWSRCDDFESRDTMDGMGLMEFDGICEEANKT
jgi:hypothetical protein